MLSSTFFSHPFLKLGWRVGCSTIYFFLMQLPFPPQLNIKPARDVLHTLCPCVPLPRFSINVLYDLPHHLICFPTHAHACIQTHLFSHALQTRACTKPASLLSEWAWQSWILLKICLEYKDSLLVGLPVSRPLFLTFVKWLIVIFLLPPSLCRSNQQISYPVC